MAGHRRSRAAILDRRVKPGDDNRRTAHFGGQGMMTWWSLGFSVAALVVVVVAALLLAIIWQCQRIVRLSRTGLAVVEEIDRNTRCIWSLGETGAVAGRLRTGAEAIERNAGAIVRAVSHETDERAA